VRLEWSLGRYKLAMQVLTGFEGRQATWRFEGCYNIEIQDDSLEGRKP
jgi:hypothetical protein